MKIKIIKNIAPLSDREINDTKDFHSVLKKRNQYLSKVQSLNNFRLKFLLSILILSALGLAVYFSDNLSITDNSRQKNEFTAPLGQLPIDIDELNLLEDSILVSKDTKPIKEGPSTSEKTENDVKPKVKKQAKNTPSEPKELAKSEPKEKSTELVYAYEEAYPLVGMDSIYKYLDQSIRYPLDASISDSIQGTSIVHFTIDQNGKATEIKVSNSLGPAFDRECIRLIKNMPPWQPAKVNGKPTKSNMSVPLRFNFE